MTKNCCYGLPRRRLAPTVEYPVDSRSYEYLQRKKLLEVDNAILRDLLERAIIGGTGWKADAKAWLGGKHRKATK